MEESLLKVPVQFAAQVEITVPYLIQLISRVLHILAAIILVGGLFFLRSVLAAKGSESWFTERRAIWARWVGIATLLLLITGFYNFFVIHTAAKAGGEELPATYHALFGIKFLLGLLVMFLAAILAGKTAAADKFRQNMRKWLNLSWLAGMAIVVIAAILRTLH